MKKLLFPVLMLMFLSACSPHPGTGVWKAQGENSLGIPGLTVAFDGKAAFTSKGENAAIWHCFWNASGEQTINLDCTPSTNTESEMHFVLTAEDDQTAALSRDGKSIGLFIRGEGNPAIP